MFSCHIGVCTDYISVTGLGERDQGSEGRGEGFGGK